MAFTANYKQINLQDAVELPRCNYMVYADALYIVTNYNKEKKIGSAWIIYSKQDLLQRFCEWRLDVGL